MHPNELRRSGPVTYFATIYGFKPQSVQQKLMYIENYQSGVKAIDSVTSRYLRLKAYNGRLIWKWFVFGNNNNNRLGFSSFCIRFAKNLAVRKCQPSQIMRYKKLLLQPAISLLKQYP